MSEAAVRFSLEYEGSQVWLVSEERLTTVVPPSDEIGDEPHMGFWYELRDAEDRVLYSKMMYNPIALDDEVFDPESGVPSPVPVEQVTGSFWLFAPDDAQASQLVLHSSPIDRETRWDPAVELARFDLESQP
ncbi:hypothetical protein ABZ299_15205 [Streptomyces sp. NPDC006184]|uniref:hypothetical protein n=1 Tax=Streptomyces sp. NPDC006184 TaxID=3155455 RepID=UPI0033A6C386